MTSASFIYARVLPKTTPVLRQSLKLIPPPLLHQSLGLGLNQAFKGPLQQGDLDFMRGRRIRIQVPDLDLVFALTLKDNRLQSIGNSTDTELTFRAELADLFQIATGRADPDTLFFRRRLLVSGDTELGLQIKNFLAGLEPGAVIPHPLHRLLKLITRRTE